MRAFFVAAVSVIATTVLSFANEMTSGKIAEFETRTKTVTLDDGIAYFVPGDFDFSELRIGDQVSFTWEMKDGKHSVSKVEIEPAAESEDD